jgi:hypothetical protein
MTTPILTGVTHVMGSRPLAAGVLGGILAACSASPPTTSQPPSLDPSPTTTASNAPATQTAAPSDSAPSSADGALMQVVSDELRMRVAAGTDAGLVGTLVRGSTVRVESGPVEADGYAWFEVVDLMGRQGWAAGGDGTDPWLAQVAELSNATPILTLEYGCDVVPPINPPATTVLDDGWVLTTERVAEGGWIVRRLSPSGLDEIREDVLGSPYLRASATFEPQRLPGAEPPGHGACLYTFTIATDGAPIVVESIGWFGDEEESQFYAPSPERKALDSIARNLIAIDDILPDDAWEGRALPYIAKEYVLAIVDGTGPAPESTPAIEPATLGLGDLDEFGSSHGFGRCGMLTRAQAFEVARVLNATGAASVRLDHLTYLSFTTDDGWVSAQIVPRFPGGMPDCESLP